ncbi:hypothetical protein [Prosthecochloris vibrioformis]|uniref:Uncharacterized protein n=1 Tax=Prosthecochloris vibrioformis TaxID=1098 RepID=A0A5C4RSV3_PROVB|nr:hypothetical protein [Prosthecochloris vibrioformis]TNJ34062.1 hypothetical protein FGF68_10545 [Prosthecochloris vibrioformis]
MSSSIYYKYFIVLLGCSFLSGFVLKTELGGKGIIVFSQLVLSFVLIFYVFSNTLYEKRWFFLSIGLILLLIVNGSRIGSTLMVCVNLVMFYILRKGSGDINIGKLIGYKFLYVYIFFALLVGGYDFMQSDPFMWTLDNKFFELGRLKMFTSEPSYLGMLIAPMLFYENSYINKFALGLVVLLTQSYFAFLFICFIWVLKSKYYPYVVVVLGGIVLNYIYALSFYDFFQDSGLVRLVGIKLFDDIGSLLFFLGGGLGSGDAILTNKFQAVGVDIGNGFAFSTLYDLGIIGLLLFSLIVVRGLREFFILLFLLFNFGIGSVLVPLLFFLSSQVYKSKSYEDSVCDK